MEGHEGDFWGDGTILYLDLNLDSYRYTFVKTQNYTLRKVYLILCKLLNIFLKAKSENWSPRKGLEIKEQLRVHIENLKAGGLE